MQYHPYQGHYKTIKGTSSSEEIDEYEQMALALRCGIRPEDMERMSYVSFVNILLSNVEDKDKPKKATKEDIERFKGGL